MADHVDKADAWDAAVAVPRKTAKRIETLHTALEIADIWLTRWAIHVANCPGGNKCTCGLSRVRYDVASALETESP